MKKVIKNFLYGIALGVTETVPGVSGGTIAVILGFYDDLIKSVNHLRRDFKNSVKFLTPLLFGAASGILVFGSVISYLLNNHSFPTMSFFIGLITGIIPIIYLKIKEPGKMLSFKEISLIAVPVLILLAISKIKAMAGSADTAESIQNIGVSFMFFIFFTGIIAAAAFVIPGVSGSFVLLLFGVYPIITQAISYIGVFFADISNLGLLANICKALAPLAAGVLIGGLTTARIIEKLLGNHYKILYSIILGLDRKSVV
jgi:putative membrane protein